jgi:hypothetical protein
MLRSHRLPWALALVIAAFLVGCATPARDSDGSPGDAQTLQPGLERRDRLDCQEPTPPDCVDWFALEIPREGEIRLEVAATHPEGLAPDYEVTLANHRGDPLRRLSNQGRTEVQMEWSVDPGTYFVAIGSGPSKTVVQYRLLARYQPLAARDDSQPKREQRRETRFETVSSMVLEVETGSGRPRFVVIDGGRRSGHRTGFRGRLVEGGRSVAEIEIVDVFEEGSRARIATELAGAITPQTMAEIDIPVGVTR